MIANRVPARTRPLDGSPEAFERVETRSPHTRPKVRVLTRLVFFNVKLVADIDGDLTGLAVAMDVQPLGKQYDA